MRHLTIAALGCIATTPLLAQSLADRVGNAATPRVQFSYAARTGVCGNGRSFIQVAGNQWYGSWNDGDRQEACAPGPIRIVIDRAGKEIVSLSSYAGPLQDVTSGVTDLGRV